MPDLAQADGWSGSALVAWLRVLPGVVLMVAGAAKLRTRRDFRDSLVGFGVPPRLREAVAWCVPAGELAAGLALVAGVLATAAAAAALALVAAFTLLLVHRLRREGEVHCQCFGHLLPGESGGPSLARNGVLLASLAGWLLAPEPARPLARGEGLLLVLAALQLLMAYLIGAAVFARNREELARLESLGVGVLADPTGDPEGGTER